MVGERRWSGGWMCVWLNVGRGSTIGVVGHRHHHQSYHFDEFCQGREQLMDGNGSFGGSG